MEAYFLLNSNAETVTLVNRMWSPHLLDTLNRMRKCNLFCDVVIATGSDDDQPLTAHACVLAASSELLKSILDAEPRRRYIVLKLARKEILAVCLEYLYGQDVYIKCEQVSELHDAAEALELTALKLQCAQALRSIKTVPSAQAPSLADDGPPVADDPDGLAADDGVLSGYTDDEMSGSEPDDATDSNIWLETLDIDESSLNETILKLENPKFKVETLELKTEPVDMHEDNVASKTFNTHEAKASPPDKEAPSVQPEVQPDVQSDVQPGVQSDPNKKVVHLNTSVNDIVQKILKGTKDPNQTTLKVIIKQPQPKGVLVKESPTKSGKIQMVGWEHTYSKPDPSTELKNKASCAVRSTAKATTTMPSTSKGGASPLKRSYSNKVLLAILKARRKEEENRSMLCDCCGKTYRGAATLRRHQEYVAKHPDGKEKKDDKEAKRKRKIAECERKKNKEYTCTECNQVFRGYYNFYYHKQEVHEDPKGNGGKLYMNKRKPVMCDHCGHTFKGLSRLKIHMERVKNNPKFVSPSFDKVVQKQREKRNREALSHRTYSCPLCGAEFKGWRNLYNHKKIVHEKKFVCQYCNKAFSEPKQKTNHEKRHRQEKNFKCQYCDFTAVTKPEVRDHEDSRHGNKLYSCAQCPQTFSSRLRFRHHARTHHILGEHKCPHCDFQGLSMYLKKHIENMHSNVKKSWYCQLCGKTFTNKSHLDRHLVKTHHTAPTPSAKRGTSLLGRQYAKHTGCRVNVSELCSVQELTEAPSTQGVLNIPLHNRSPSKERGRSRQRTKKESSPRIRDVIEEYPADDGMVYCDAAGNWHHLGHVSVHVDDATEVHMAAQSLF